MQTNLGYGSANNTVDEQYLAHLRTEQLVNICRTYEINEIFAAHLQNLQGYEIVIVADDSGSMNTPANNKFLSIQNSIQPTRWDELKYTLSILIDIAAVMDRNGVDVYFLNRAPLLNVTHHGQLDQVFQNPPRGYTPIAPVLNTIFNTTKPQKRLIILATDGEPTDANGVVDIDGFKNVLKNNRPLTDYVTIIACTDDKKTMKYLNNWDKQLPNLDIIDDYGSELKEIRKAQGSNFKFSYGDYVVKAMMGSVDPYFDALDEHKVGTKSRCTIS